MLKIAKMSKVKGTRPDWPAIENCVSQDMESISVRGSSTEDLDGILALHSKGSKDASLSWPIAREDLNYLEHDLSVVALAGGIVVGYLLSFDSKLNHLLTHPKAWGELGDMSYKGAQMSNYDWCFGQSCVDARYRRRGVFSSMYTLLKRKSAHSKFDLRVARISSTNLASIAAHSKIDMREVGSIVVDGHDKIIMALDLK